MSAVTSSDPDIVSLSRIEHILLAATLKLPHENERILCVICIKSLQRGKVKVTNYET